MNQIISAMLRIGAAAIPALLASGCAELIGVGFVSTVIVFSLAMTAGTVLAFTPPVVDELEEMVE